MEFNISKIIGNLKNKFSQVTSGKVNEITLEQQLENEKIILKKLRKFESLYEEGSFDFDSTDENERQKMWRIIWNVIDSKNPSSFENDKKLTNLLLLKAIKTRSRYLGKDSDGNILFISKNDVITTIQPKHNDLIIIYSDAKRLKRDIRDSELRIENLKRML